jgi:hypothetical protein
MWYGRIEVGGLRLRRAAEIFTTEVAEKRGGESEARWTALVLACLLEAGATGEGKKSAGMKASATFLDWTPGIAERDYLADLALAWLKARVRRDL